MVTVRREAPVDRRRLRAPEAPDPGPNNDLRGVVVGVDGSEHSKAALSRAVEEARLRLDVVMTWQQPINAELDWPSSARLESDTCRALDKIIGSVLGDQPAVQVRTTTASGPAGHVLRGRSEHATLLVVGNRGHGEVPGLPLGSVIGFLATHTRCPALIVRGTPSHVEIATPPPTSLTSPQPSPAANAGEAREEVDRSLPVAGAVARADG